MYSQLPGRFKRERDYLSYFSEEERCIIETQFSEHVLYSAQAISRGFRLSGIEQYPVSLYEAAAMLCSQWDALRFVLRTEGQLQASNQAPPVKISQKRAVSHRLSRLVSVLANRKQPEYHEKVETRCADKESERIGGHAKQRGVVLEFVDAWCAFERALTLGYAHSARARRLHIKLEIAQRENEGKYWVSQITRAIHYGVASKLVSSESVQNYSPEVLWCVPRLAILRSFRDEDTDNSHNASLYNYFFYDKLHMIPDVRSQVKGLSPVEFREMEVRVADNTATTGRHEELFRTISLLADELNCGQRAACWRDVLQVAFEGVILFWAKGEADEDNVS
jgi:hypothetical protein